MYFDFDEYRPETPSIGSAISRREGVLLSIIGHLAAVVLMLAAPELPWVRAAAERQALEREQQRLALLEAQQRDSARFVFMQPMVETPPPPAPPPVAELSDRDRVAQALERAERPTNPLPFARGNTPERVVLPEASPRARERAAEAEMAGAGSAEGLRTGDGEAATAPPAGSLILPGGSSPASVARREGALSSSGALGEALRNLERYVQQESFHNEQGGGGQYNSSIQFDSKGVEFGPWIRRFVAQIKRNWFVPYAAMSLKGQVVITFYVHKDGTLAELAVSRPSSVDAFNNSSFNALAASNPTQPLPPEYPADRAFFTVTFYYNEQPAQ
jgi:TonB family protein